MDTFERMVWCCEIGFQSNSECNGWRLLPKYEWLRLVLLKDPSNCPLCRVMSEKVVISNLIDAKWGSFETFEEIDHEIVSTMSDNCCEIELKKKDEWYVVVITSDKPCKIYECLDYEVVPVIDSSGKIVRDLKNGDKGGVWELEIMGGTKLCFKSWREDKELNLSVKVHIVDNYERDGDVFYTCEGKLQKVKIKGIRGVIKFNSTLSPLHAMMQDERRRLGLTNSPKREYVERKIEEIVD